MSKWKNLIPPVAWMAAIYLLSSIPGRETPQTAAERLLHWTPPELQNLLHVPLYGILAWLWLRALCPAFLERRRAALVAMAISGGWGVLDEWHQLHVPGRYGSLTDLALDLAGVMLVVAPAFRREGGRR